MQLTIRGFRGIEETETLHLDKPLNLFVGPNAAGKSSVLAAVHVAITGKHPEYCARQGESVYDLRRWGAKLAEIDVYAHGHIFKRLITASKQTLNVMGVALDEDGSLDEVQSTVWTGTTTEQQADLYAAWGLNADQVHAVLSGSQFLAMSAKEQTGFMAALGGSELTVEMLWQAVGHDSTDQLPGHFDMADIATAIKPAYDSGLEGAALLDECDKLAREARRAAKQEQSRLATLLEEVKSTMPPKPESAPVTEEDIERIEKLGQDRFAAEKRAGQIQAADLALSSWKDRLDENQKSYDAAVEALGAGPSDEQIAEQEAAVSNAKEQLEQVQAKRQQLQDARDSGRQVLAGARQRLRELQKLADGQCPLCASEIAAEKLAAWVAEQDADIQAKEEALHLTHDAFMEAHRALPDWEVAFAGADTTLMSLQRTRGNLETQHRHAQGNLAEAKTVVGEQQSRRNGIGPLIDTAAINDELAKLILRRDEWAGYTQAAGQLNAAKADLKEQEAKVEALQWAVAKFGSGPESYRVELLGDGLAPLKDSIDEYLQQFLSMDVVFPAGDTPLSVRRVDSDGEAGITHPASLQFLSGSEYFRVQLILQYAFARALDFPIMLVDCEVQLDDASAQDVMLMMAAIANEWPEVRILATAVETGLEGSAYIVEGWADTWLVRDGQVALYDGPGDDV